MTDTEKFNEILKIFDINAQCVSVCETNNIISYNIILSPGSKIKDLERFDEEILLLLKTNTKAKPLIRISPSEGLVKYEVIKDDIKIIDFFEHIPKVDLKSNSDLYLGKYTNGKDVVMDFTKNPHLLVSGATGSGKTVFLHTILSNLMFKENIEISVIDTKGIDFIGYYKLINNFSIIDNYNDAIKLIDSLIDKMDSRYQNMIYHNVFDYTMLPVKPITSVLIIDEYADLILYDDSKELFRKLTTLVQKCRASGIYCILATQRPSSDIINGLIKANFTARVACRTASSVDSRVILGKNGAELLCGYGDAIINNYNNSFERIQVAYSSPQRIKEMFDI